MAERTKVEVNELSERILAGVRKAVRQLIEANAAKDEDMVVGDQYGNVKTVPAKQLLKELQGQA